MWKKFESNLPMWSELLWSLRKLWIGARNKEWSLRNGFYYIVLKCLGIQMYQFFAFWGKNVLYFNFLLVWKWHHHKNHSMHILYVNQCTKKYIRISKKKVPNHSTPIHLSFLKKETIQANFLHFKPFCDFNTAAQLSWIWFHKVYFFYEKVTRGFYNL